MDDSERQHTELAIVDERTLRDKIYTVRGVKVMLDFELAELYGYETKNFNRQVKNNAEKFEGDAFMFQLTREEFNSILRCKNFTSSWGGTRYLPYAFTERTLYRNREKTQGMPGKGGNINETETLDHPGAGGADSGAGIWNSKRGMGRKKKPFDLFPNA